MSDTGPHHFEMDKWISSAPFEQLLQMTIIRAEHGTALLTMPFTVELAQGAGLMHGGALVSLADTAVVMAIKSIVEPLTHFATTSMQSRFLYPVTRGIVTAEAAIVRNDGRTLEGKAAVYNEDRRLVMEFSSLFKIAHEGKIQGVTFTDESGP